jgi:hypothetical protein
LDHSKRIEAAMPTFSKDKLLQSKIEQQRQTIASLKREGHEYSDAERHLTQLLAEAQLANSKPEPLVPSLPHSAERRFE